MGTLRTHLNADCLLEDFSGKNHENIVDSKLLMASLEFLFLESESFFIKYVSSCPNTKYLYLQLPFLKMKA